MKDALEQRWRVRVPAKHNVIPWLIEYASLLLNRFEVSRDGKTAYERCKGKVAKTLGIEFGEAVWWRKKPAGTAAKLASGRVEDQDSSTKTCRRTLGL